MTPNEIAESVYNTWHKNESEPTYCPAWDQLSLYERRAWYAVADMFDRAVRQQGEIAAERHETLETTRKRLGEVLIKRDEANARIAYLEGLLASAISFIERTQYRVSDETAKEFARELKEGAGL